MKFKTIIIPENIVISSLRRISKQIFEEMGDDLYIELDFQNVTYVTSITLGVVTEIYKKLHSKEGILRLINVDPYIKDVFHITGFDSIIAISCLSMGLEKVTK